MCKDRAGLSTVGGPALHNCYAKRTWLREGEGNGPCQEVEARHVFETYAIEKYCGFCREQSCAQAYVKVGVGAQHGGNGKTKQNANKGVVYSRENWLWCCG